MPSHLHILLLALTLLPTTQPTRAPFFQTTGSFTFPNNNEPLTVYYYKPTTYNQSSSPILIVLHGTLRNAEEYRNFAIPLGDRFSALILTPEFDLKRFPSERYQRGGITKAGLPQPKESWTYAAIPRLANHVRNLENNPTKPYYLIGHSAGGQFLIRYAAFMGAQPNGPTRIVAANSGSALFPTTDQPFGYGFGTLPESLANDDIYKAYLAAPLTLYLGTADTTPEHSFDGSEKAMIQGDSRLARNRNAYAFAQNLAREKGWPFNWRKVETYGIEHAAAKMFAAPEVADALFGTGPSPASQPATRPTSQPTP